MEVTAENIGEVTSSISSIVQTNSTEDQSSNNLLIVTDVLTDTVALLGNISVSQKQQVDKAIFFRKSFVLKCTFYISQGTL